jgi:hypothetical protein
MTGSPTPASSIRSNGSTGAATSPRPTERRHRGSRAPRRQADHYRQLVDTRAMRGIASREVKRRPVSGSAVAQALNALT